jgi:NADH-quinone oxidoreductase subunit A
MFFEYIFILKYLIFCIIISFLLFSLSFFFVFQKPDVEKLSAYECGFNPFGDARIQFNIKFYIVVFYLLFLIWKLFFYFLELFL